VIVEGITIQVHNRLYQKDPEGSDLGRRILQNSILLIDEIGFEAFTFRKLAVKIHSTEASIYRYFENKHKLLLYLVNWYWSWLELHMLLSFSNLNSPFEKLEKAIDLFTRPIGKDQRIEHIDEDVLHRILIAEYSKAYLTKNVDAENREGFFSAYKSLCALIASLIQQINPDYSYPHSLVSSAIEASISQQFFTRHLPRLSDLPSKDCHMELRNFIKQMIFNTISNNE
jgi:AcrR family transcriptional regulator